MVINLYYERNSSAFAVLVALEEAGLEYATHRVDFSRGDQRSSAYLSVNPAGMIPALEVDGVVITELIAILSYVAEAAPRAELLPSPPLARAQVYERLAWFSTSMHVAIAQIFRTERFTADMHAAKCVAEHGRERFKAFAAQLESLASSDRAWLMGPTFTLVDAVALIAWRWMLRLAIDPAPYPNLEKRIGRTLKRGSVDRAHERELHEDHVLLAA